MNEAQAYLNGRFVPCAQASIPIWLDAGFVLGRDQSSEVLRDFRRQVVSAGSPFGASGTFAPGRRARSPDQHVGDRPHRPAVGRAQPPSVAIVGGRSESDDVLHARPLREHVRSRTAASSPTVCIHIVSAAVSVVDRQVRRRTGVGDDRGRTGFAALLAARAEMPQSHALPPGRCGSSPYRSTGPSRSAR